MSFTFYSILFGMLATFLLFAVWMLFVVIIQHRRIKNICMSVDASIRGLRGSVCVTGCLNDADSASFENIRAAFNRYIKPHAKYRDNLLSALNAICGTSYSIIDMHDCFENRRFNAFFKDITAGSGYLFINIIYMAQLEQKGFRSLNFNGIGKYL